MDCGEGAPVAAGGHVMRRAGSILLFVAGALILVTSLMAAFLEFPDSGPSFSGNVGMAAAIAFLAAVPLLLGAWASPGQGWRELGLTILIAVGMTLLLVLITFPFDPQLTRYAEPGWKVEFAPVPVFGTLNLLLVAGIGWLLYRRRSLVCGERAPTAAGGHVMRRAVSILLFVAGGWVLVANFLVTFYEGPEPGRNLSRILNALIAAVPLLLGAWASPGQRSRELGLTILTAVGIALLCIMSIVALSTSPAVGPYMPPLFGVLNLLVTAVLGWLLFREGARVSRR